MAFLDMGLQELQAYSPRMLEAGDFDDFWAETLEESRQRSRKPARFTPVGNFEGVEAWDVEFPGFAGQPIKAWYLLPAKKIRSRTPLPCIMAFIGYGGGRGFPHQWLLWPSLGYGVFVMDTRGQGSVWQKGDTPDAELEAGNPQSPGFLTRGIASPWHYYYRRVYTDAVMAIQTIARRKEINPLCMITDGSSQGGGISLAASGLSSIINRHPGWKGEKIVPAACIADVPFMCNIQRACQITNSHPYQELATWLRTHRDQEDQAFATLSYFDGVNLARRIKVPGLFSVGLMDDVCPPSTVYAAYNAYQGSKSMKVYTYNGHEGGGEFQTLEKIDFIRKMVPPREG